MPVSILDKLYRKMLLSKFFTRGWGHPDDLLQLFKFRKIISNRETCFNLVNKNHQLVIMNDETWPDYRIIEGRFSTPMNNYLPDLIHQQVNQAFFQIILPRKWKSAKHKPICIHLAGTGDHYFWRRRHIMAKPLLKNDIGSIILENPFYGFRKPHEQSNSCLLNVTDIFVMGGCLMLECLVLLHWCEQNGFGPLGITGLSMGGHMASLAATCWPKPLVLVPCLSWSTASKVFTEGVMSDSINWDHLQQQILTDGRYMDALSEIESIFETPYTDLSCRSPYGSRKKGSNLFQVLNDNNIKGKSSQTQNEKNKWNFLDFISNLASSKSESMKKRDPEAVFFMRKIMDECTHLQNFSKPYDTSLIIAVCAQADAYVPRDGCTRLEDIWPGATIRYLNTGHVGAYIWYRNVFRDSIIEAFERAKRRYP